MPAKNAAASYAGIIHWQLEPFCSTECCRAFHEVEMTETKLGLGNGGGRRKVYA